MRRKLSFLLLVCLFTVFGGGRSERWAVICTDSNGYVYEVELRSIERLAPQTVSLLVRTQAQDSSVLDRWTLRAGESSLETERFPRERYGPGSVPNQVELFLRNRGYLAPGLVSPPVEGSASR